MLGFSSTHHRPDRCLSLFAAPPLLMRMRPSTMRMMRPI
jgi:hypothetical protein